MLWVAMRMLVGDTAKFLGILFGVAFASLLMGQQFSTFCGLMLLTTSQIQDIHGANLWVMDPNVQFIDDIKPMTSSALYRVRGVEGVAWAVPLYKGLSRARLADGKFQQVILLGLDDATQVGAPLRIVAGKLEDLRLPDAILMDRRGYDQLWPNEPFRPGKVFEMNDRRAVLVGLCVAAQTFQTFPIVYTRFSQATRFVPAERKVLSFILAQSAPGRDPQEVCRAIREQTKLQAQTREQFIETTIFYYLRRTGIPFNFGITVGLGFLVGTAIAGQTFYLFTVENLRQLGTLKAMGATGGQLIGMILMQAAVVGVLGLSIGLGLTAIYGRLVETTQRVAFYTPWWALPGVAAAVLLMMVFASLLSIRRVLVLDAAIVFRG